MDNQNQSQDQSTNLTPPPQASIIKRLLSLYSQHKYIIISVIVLAFLSLGSTGYLLMANKKTESASQASNQTQQKIVIPTLAPVSQKTTTLPTPTPTPTPTIAPLISPTASWSAYVSTKYVFSIKYPLDWTAKLTASSDPKILEYVVFNPKTSTSTGSLSITLSYTTRTPIEALALDPQKGIILRVASASATQKTQKDSDGNVSINTIIPDGVRTIIINAKDKYKSTLDQMLTTVKLTL